MRKRQGARGHPCLTSLEIGNWFDGELLRQTTAIAPERSSFVISMKV
jgi:hypothetical protein